MLAVRVPPSAWRTSQSTVTVRSPRRPRSTTPRSERPIRRWISWVRPPILPAVASRCVRSAVERGSIEYSAVTQPLPLPAQVRRDPVLDRGRAEDLRVADADPAGALGPLLDAERHRHRPQLVRPAPRRAQGRARFPIVIAAPPRGPFWPPARRRRQLGLRRVPQLVELGEREVAQGDGALGRQPLHDPEAAAELLVGGPQRGLRLHVVVAGQVDDDHEQVAELLGAGGRTLGGGELGRAPPPPWPRIPSTLGQS